MKRLLYSIAAVGLLVFIVAAQMSNFDQSGVRRFKVLKHPSKEVLVGVCWPFSVNQDGMAEGLQLAQEQINSGKLAGPYSIRLLMRDDKFDGKRARKIADEFADTPEMSAVIGYYDDGPAVKASPIYETSRLLHMIIGANNTAMTSHGFQYIVRTTLASERIAKTLAKICIDLNYRKIALIWEEDTYGEDLAYQFSVSLDSMNIRLAYFWSYNRRRADFRLPVNEIKGIDADVIFFAGLEPLAGDFIRSARAIGLKTPIIGAFSDTPEMRLRAGTALEGAMYFEMYSMESPSPENQKFVLKFRARFGKNPDTWAAQGYDALHILAKAIKFTSSRNPLDLSYAIRYMDAWEGANGRYKFDKTGELENKPVYIKMFQHGTPVTIKKGDPVSMPAP